MEGGEVHFRDIEGRPDIHMESCFRQTGKKGPRAQTAPKAGDGNLEVFSLKKVPRDGGNHQGKK